MPTLAEMFQDYDTDQVDIVAEQWGIEEEARGKNRPKLISKGLNDKTLFFEIVEALPVRARHAINALAAASGKITRGVFEREYGEVREMGAARREKERPDINPHSVSENLFYKGIIAHAFFEDDSGAAEFVYLPDEFLVFLKSTKGKMDSDQVPLGYLKKTVGEIRLAGSEILDSITLTLAALRGDIPPSERQCLLPEENYALNLSLLKVWASSMQT